MFLAVSLVPLCIQTGAVTGATAVRSMLVTGAVFARLFGLRPSVQPADVPDVPDVPAQGRGVRGAGGCQRIVEAPLHRSRTELDCPRVAFFITR